MKLRKHYSAAFRANTVQELLKGEKSVAEIAFEYGVRPTQLLKWKVMELEDLENSNQQSRFNENLIILNKGEVLYHEQF